MTPVESITFMCTRRKDRIVCAYVSVTMCIILKGCNTSVVIGLQEKIALCVGFYKEILMKILTSQQCTLWGYTKY